MGRASQRRAELGRGLQTPGPHATAPGLVTGKDAPAPGKGGPWGTDGQVVAHGEMAAPLPDGHADGSGAAPGGNAAGPQPAEAREARAGKQTSSGPASVSSASWRFLAETSPSGVSARVFKCPRVRRADYL